jgi:hypothetical protein
LGQQFTPIAQPNLDWELKAAPKPYNVLQEVLTEYQLHPSAGVDDINIEIVAFNVAAVDSTNSTVAGEHATIRVYLARGLRPERFSLGYAVYKDGSPTFRDVIPSDEFEWSQRDAGQWGTTTIQVPNAAVVNCVTVYEGIAQSHYWLSDPSRRQNSRRAVHEAFDPNLSFTKEIFGSELRKGFQARQLEAAVAWLLWMLGFSVAQLGDTPRTQDAADVIATTPNGHFAVVECTTGLLRADKLSTLHSRALAARRALDTSSHIHLRILPVIVTTRTRDEIKGDLDQAQRLGIFVIDRETLDEMLNRTIRFQNPDQIFEEAEWTVRAALSKYETRDKRDKSVEPPLG